VIKNTGLVTGASFASMFFLGVGTAIIGAAAGNIGLTPYETGLLVTAQNIGFIIAVLAAGALSDSLDKGRLMLGGSLILALSFLFYYMWKPYALNLAIMFILGIGIGTYEGTADAMLLGLHRKRQGLFVSINHFFVTFGCLAITAYLIFLQMDWRRSMMQSAIVVFALTVFFAFTRGGAGAEGTPKLGARLKFLGTQPVLAVLFVAAVCGVGIELGLTSFLPGFLLELRGYDLVSSKIGLLLFLAGSAAGRVAFGVISSRVRLLPILTALFVSATVTSTVTFFVPMPVPLAMVFFVLSGLSVSCILPFLVTLTGRLFADMSGTALGILKLGIPIGGIVVPFVLSMLLHVTSFSVCLGIFPVLGVAGLVLLLATARMIGRKLEGAAGGAAR
jgi:MFS family permease